MGKNNWFGWTLIGIGGTIQFKHLFTIGQECLIVKK